MGEIVKAKHRKLRIGCLVSVLVLAVAISAFFVVGACSPTWFSEEGHLQRVSKRIDKKYIQSGEYESFEIRPLYNENDELKYFVVDFKPSGFLYVRIRDENYFAIFGESMYITSLHKGQGMHKWRRYTVQKVVDVDGGVSFQNVYETDENGEYIYYSESCYKMANMDNEKMYLFECAWSNHRGYIPAVKNDKEYTNLISMQTFDKSMAHSDPMQSLIGVNFILEWEFNL